jgi:hypothetical protein
MGRLNDVAILESLEGMNGFGTAGKEWGTVLSLFGHTEPSRALDW